IGHSQALAGWLHKVAYRVALRARAVATRRGQREQTGLDLDAVAGREETSPGWRELRPLLDQEVSRLPERYRVPVILCYLEGKTYDEIARQLGCSRGTVGTWLARARDLLRRRLTRRGLVVSAAVLAAVLAEQAPGA